MGFEHVISDIIFPKKCKERVKIMFLFGHTHPPVHRVPGCQVCGDPSELSDSHSVKGVVHPKVNYFFFPIDYSPHGHLSSIIVFIFVILKTKKKEKQLEAH